MVKKLIDWITANNLLTHVFGAAIAFVGVYLCIKHPDQSIQGVALVTLGGGYVTVAHVTGK
jgi:hypothetical protein